MKLCRVGKLNKEKPALIDKDGNFRDMSSIVNDFNPETLNFETIEKIKKTDLSKLPIINSEERIGACVSKPSKFIGIGLNFKDHAEEQNLPIPKEPIIFSKFVNSFNLSTAGIIEATSSYVDSIELPPFGTSKTLIFEGS